MNAAQTLKVNGAPMAEPTVVPLALTSDEVLPGTQQIPKVDTKSRPDRRIENTNTSQSLGVKKSKHEEQQQRYINHIPQQRVTARSQSRKAQSQRDKKANRGKQNAPPVFRLQSHQERVDTNLKDKEGAVASGAAQEPEAQDLKERERHDNSERKRWGVMCSTSSISINCTHHVCSHVRPII